MTRDDIITMAREAGIVEDDGLGYFLCSTDLSEFLNFAALVAAKERRKHQADIERWKGEAAKAEKWRSLALSKDGDGRTVQRIQQEAAEAEREACANIDPGPWGILANEMPGSVWRKYKAAIRARGN